MVEPKRILLVEDNVHDAELILNAFAQHGLAQEVVTVRDGAEVLDYLYRQGHHAERQPENPAVILLDIKMPKVDGLNVLRQIKTDPELRLIPVVMLTSSREEFDLAASYKLGANAYVVKPIDFQEFLETVKFLGVFWARVNEPPACCSRRRRPPEGLDLPNEIPD